MNGKEPEDVAQIPFILGACLPLLRAHSLGALLKEKQQ